MNRCHVQAALATVHKSRIPVLFTVPLKVMREAASMRDAERVPATSRNVFSPKAGFEVFIKGIVLLSTTQTPTALNRFAVRLRIISSILDSPAGGEMQDYYL